MKVVLLAGGLGTRLREETEFRPKPMVAIGGRPILWHIMKTYAHHGHTDFVICLGYKGEVIRDYFLNYELRNRDVTVTLGSRELQIHGAHGEGGWKITLADTGEATLTGGRLGRVGHYLGREPFMVTYGDGVADVDVDKLLAFHRSHGKLATLTAVRPSSRFGEVVIDRDMVQFFQEKPQVQGGWINGGFFVFEPAVLPLIAGDDESLEQSLLMKLTSMRQLAVYQHHGFWQCMDTPREMDLLNELWRQDKAAWAVWR
ncbi:MAG TPA: glucose-1-phosphate cytidylyltransferase [Methylomirabilota bacterium]|jgi:glucose-1-phosphate cytidylyltransferase